MTKTEKQLLTLLDDLVDHCESMYAAVCEIPAPDDLKDTRILMNKAARFIEKVRRREVSQ